MLTNWQGQLYAAHPDTPLWQMSIPGTHDTAARENYFTNADKCQNWSVTEQLDNGIRFLDLRLNYNNENNRDKYGFTGFDIYHGGFQYATFKPAWYGVVDPTRADTANVYAEMVDWLKQNPSEFVIVNVANTGGTAADAYTDEFWKIINSVSDGVSTGDAPLWFLYDVVSDSKAKLTYENMKGKFVLIRSDPGWSWQRSGSTLSLGLPCNASVHNGFSATVPYFQVQNYWEDIGFDEKMAAIRELFEKIQATAPSAEQTFFNWISRGFNGIHGPEYYANYYNPFLSDLIDAMRKTPSPTPTVPAPPSLGVVVMDFPTVALIEKIIGYKR